MSDDVSDAVLAARISATYRVARERYAAHHKSRHWDVFPSDYAVRLADPASWPQFRSNGLTAGFDAGVRTRAARSGKDDRREREKTLQRFQALRDIVGEEFIRTHHEASIGHPWQVCHDGVTLNTTDLRLCHDAWRLGGLLGARRDAELTIVEIGAGYGGLARKLKGLFPHARLLLFDLPEVNAVQTYYLARALPDVGIVDYVEFAASGWSLLQERKADVVILPGWCIETLPAASVDVVVNTRSMAEMNRDTLAYYFEQIHRVARDGALFYCVNRYVKSTVGEAVRFRDYPFDDRWATLVSRPAWDQPWLHELAALRVPEAVPLSTRHLVATLPPRRWRDAGAALRELWRTLAVLVWGSPHGVNPGLRYYLRHGVEVARRAIGRAVGRRAKA